MQVEVTKAEVIATGITKYEFRAPDGGDLSPWQAGAHLDIVVAPEFLRQYSMSGDPADRSCYQIAVLREEEGRGGSKLMQRIFTVGRRVFISRPLNHFPMAAEASNSLLMGGGIGITPMIAMAHELHAQDRDFTLHYSGRSRATMGFLADIAPFAWASRVRLHISDEGSRADFAAILQDQPDGTHLYTCGAEHYMGAVMAAAAQAGMPEDALHLEHFSVPEMPDYENYDFILRLAKTGRDLLIPADRAATDVLAENGIHLDVKCADGLCGVCKCGLVAGDVEHRDFVLSSAQRETSVILCQSRAAKAGGVVEVDL
jgi:ferredoxin-NADP reductase